MPKIDKLDSHSNVRPENSYLIVLCLQIALLLSVSIHEMTAFLLLIFLLVIFSLLLRWQIQLATAWIWLDILLLYILAYLFTEKAGLLYLALFVFYFASRKAFVFALITLIILSLTGGQIVFWFSCTSMLTGGLFFYWQQETMEHIEEADQLRNQIYQLEQTQFQLLSDYQKTEDLLRIEERHRLAEILHDQLGHELTAADLAQKAGSALLKSGKRDEAEKMMETSSQRLHVALMKLKKAVQTIEPDKQSGMETLTSMVEASMLPASFACQGNVLNIQPYVWQLIIMTVREALTNIIKHAKPQSVTLELVVTDYVVRLLVENDGVDLQSQLSDGRGLRYMRRRLEALKGSLSIHQEADLFRLVMILPLGST